MQTLTSIDAVHRRQRNSKLSSLPYQRMADNNSKLNYMGVQLPDIGGVAML